MSDELPDTDFARVDEMPDELFYSMPRLVTHIDEAACAALSDYYRTILSEGDHVLDLMSSCVSHLPETPVPAHVVGHGMNTVELEANPQLHEFFVQNLNRSPELPFAENTFDACLIAVSIQYLVRPREVLANVARILRPGGILAISYSNRMFPTKAVRKWRETGEAGHGNLICAYIRLSAGFDNAEVTDISPRPGRSDPLRIVCAQAR